MFMTGSPQDMHLGQIPMIEKPFRLKEIARQEPAYYFPVRRGRKCGGKKTTVRESIFAPREQIRVAALMHLAVT